MGRRGCGLRYDSHKRDWELGIGIGINGRSHVYDTEIPPRSANSIQ